MIKYRVALITESGEHLAENFDTREEVDDFLLKNNAKKYRIIDRNTKQMLESERGVVK